MFRRIRVPLYQVIKKAQYESMQMGIAPMGVGVARKEMAGRWERMFITCVDHDASLD